MIAPPRTDVSSPARFRRRQRLALISGTLFVPTLAYMVAFRNEGIFHLDAIFLAQAVERLYAGDGWSTDWRFGAVLANAVVYAPFWIAGENAERATIFASVLFHALSVPVAFCFIARLSGSLRQAALSAGLFAVAPVYVVANTFGKEYGLAMLLVVAAFGMAVAAHDTGKATRAAGSALLLAFSYTVWEGLLLVTPIYAVLLLAPRRCRWRAALAPRRTRLIAGAAVGYGIGIAFALATSLGLMLRIYATESNMTGVGSATSFLPMVFRDLLRLQGLPFLAASLCGVWLACRQARNRPVLACGGLLTATILCYGSLTTYGPRYLALGALGLSMFAGAAFQFALRDAAQTRAATLSAYALSIALMLWASYPLLASRHAYNGAKRFAQFVADATEPDSLSIVMDDSRFIEYYARRATLGHPIGGRDANIDWAQRVAQESARRPVYLTNSGLTYDPGGVARQALLDHFTWTLIGTVATEDYHHAEGRLRPYDGHLWRLTPR